MARYIVNNSRFRPLEFLEMLTPVLAADQAYREYEALLSDMNALASVWENLANSAIDLDTYNLYKSFSDEVRGASDILSSEGLTPQSRSSLNRLRQSYSQNIVPIELSYATRAEEAKALQELMNKDPNVRFDRMASQTALSDYIANPQLGYRAVSGTLLALQVAALALALLNEIRSNEAEYRPILGDQYFEQVVRLGIDPNDIARAIADPDNANPLLTGIVNNVMASAGVDSFGELARNELRNMAALGLYAGVGKTDIRTLSNDKWKMDYQNAMSKDLLRYKAGLEKPDTPIDPDKPYSNIPRASSNAPVIKAYGGEKLQKTIKNLDEWATTNKYNISEGEILERLNNRRESGMYRTLPTSQLTGSGFNPRVGIAGSLMIPDDKSEKLSDRDILLNNLADSFDLYGVTNMNDLEEATRIASSMTAYVQNDIGLKLASNETAIDVLEGLINQSYSGENRALRKINRHGVVGKPLKEGEALELIRSLGKKDIKYDTELDEFVLVVDMEPYVIDKRLIEQGEDPSDLLRKLTLSNPSRIPIENEDGSRKPFSQYVNEFSEALGIYDYLSRESNYGLAARYQSYFNNASKAQGIRGAN